MPYQSLRSGEAVLTLKVVGPKDFEVVEGYRYFDQYDSFREYVVRDGAPTDLASVPFFLQWLVLSYGKHTMAAILHDEYWDDEKTQAELRQANTMFRHAMWESGVPFVRRWFMWTAVTLGMLAKTTVGRIRLAVWAAALVVAATAVLGANGVRLSWPATLSLVGGGVGLVLLTRIGAAGMSAMRRISQLVLTAVVVVGAVAVLASAVGAPDWTAGGAALAAAVALVVGLAAWGNLVAAGAIATVEVAIIFVPVVGIVFGLLAYYLLELLMRGLLEIGRIGKRRTGRQVVGTLNPVASDRLRAPEPPPEAKLKASQL